SSDHPKPWLLWTAAWIVATIVVILRWKNQWIDLVYPINSVVLHASVAVLCIWRSKTVMSRRDLLIELDEVRWNIRRVSDDTSRRTEREDDAIRSRLLVTELRQREAYLMKKLSLD
ncbi:MAG: hypothetical protein AAB726_00040, partial [Patescibacteria group bacterium]